MKKSLSIQTMILIGTFLLLDIVVLGQARAADMASVRSPSQATDTVKIFSIDLREKAIVYSALVDMGDTIPELAAHRTDSSDVVLYCHCGDTTTAYSLPFAADPASVLRTNISMRNRNIFKVQDGFVAFANYSQSGCCFSPTGLSRWYYTGRHGLDSSMVDFVATSDRNRWVIYYHHALPSEISDSATSAFVRAELDVRSRKVVRREVKIKHNKLSYDRLKVLRMTRHGYYHYLAFMQNGTEEIFVSESSGGAWSYPLPLGLDLKESMQIVDARIVRDKIFLLVLSDGNLDLVRLVLRGGRCHVKDRKQIIKLSDEDKFIKGCFVDRSRAMIVMR